MIESPWDHHLRFLQCADSTSTGFARSREQTLHVYFSIRRCTSISHGLKNRDSPTRDTRTKGLTSAITGSDKSHESLHLRFIVILPSGRDTQIRVRPLSGMLKESPDRYRSFPRPKYSESKTEGGARNEGHSKTASCHPTKGSTQGRKRRWTRTQVPLQKTSRSSAGGTTLGLLLNDRIPSSQKEGVNCRETQRV